MGSEAPTISDNGSDANPAAATSGLSKIKPQPNYPPNPTLSLSNIDWSIKKPLLKRSLLALFSRHGKVLEVICLRGDSPSGGHKPKCLRGQAWVIFESLSAATAALHAERGFVFFGRPLMVNYAKEVSDRIAKREGTYGANAKERAARKRKMEELGVAGSLEDGDGLKLTKLSDVTLPINNAAVMTTSVKDPSSLVGQQTSPPAKESSSSNVPSSSTDFANPKKLGGVQQSNSPSSLLLARNLPPECNDMMLAMLFRQYSGYKEVKLVKSDGSTVKKEGGIAMIEFETENQAAAALKGLNGFKLTMSSTLDLTYGNR